MEENKYRQLVIDDTVYDTVLSRKYLNRKRYAPDNLSEYRAYIPGTIIKIKAKVGQQINEGETVVVLEAMKMQNNIQPLKSGKVKNIYVTEGQRVAKNEILFDIE